MTVPDKSIADRINLRELEVFIAVCECSSVSAAGRREGLTQSAVSQMLRRLETRVGKVLIDRSTRPLRITADGNNFLRSARELLQTAQGVVSLFDGRMDHSISLRIGLVESLTVPFVPKLISAMGGKFAKFSVTAGTTIAQRDAFLDRRIDMAIISDSMEDVPGVEAFPIADEPFILLIPKGVPPVTTIEAMKQMCVTLPLVRFGARSTAGNVIEAQLRRMRVPIKDTFELDAPDSVIGMVAAGYGWAIINPLSLVRSWSYIDSVQMLKFPGPSFSRRLYLIARQLEFGALPERLAAKARSIVRTEYIKGIHERAEWMRGSLQTIEPLPIS